MNKKSVVIFSVILAVIAAITTALVIIQNQKRKEKLNGATIKFENEFLDDEDEPVGSENNA